MIGDSGAAVVILDPIYKMLLGLEENSNGVVAKMLNHFTKLCGQLNVSFIYANHHSKGNQALKDALDRSAGAGAWGRDPDAVLDLTAHEESDCFTAEIRVRSFAPIEPFVVRWAFPLLVRDTEGLDPTKLKQPEKTGRNGADSGEKIMTTIRTIALTGDPPALKARQIAAIVGLSSRTVRRWIPKLAPRVVKTSLIKDAYQASPTETTSVLDLLKTLEAENDGHDRDST